MATFKTDALDPSSLPTAALGRPRSLHARAQASSSLTATTSATSHKDALAKSYDDWNSRIDGQVKSLASGLKELVNLANIGETPSPHHPPVQALELNLTTARLIRATQSLRDLSHELKLTLLLSDTVQAVQRRDAEMTSVRREIAKKREDVAQAVLDLLQREAKSRGELGMSDHAGSREAVGSDAGENETDRTLEEQVETREHKETTEQVEDTTLDNGTVQAKETQAVSAKEDNDEDEGMEEVDKNTPAPAPVSAHPTPSDIEMDLSESVEADTPAQESAEEPADTVATSEAMDAVESVKAGEPAKQAQAEQPQRSEHTESVQSAEPVKPVESVDPAAPTDPAAVSITADNSDDEDMDEVY